MSLSDQSSPSIEGNRPPFTTANVWGRESKSAKPQSEAPRRIVIVERNAFLRDCLRAAVAGCWPGETLACASLAELQQLRASQGATLALLSILSLSEEETETESALLAHLDPCVRSLILANTDDLNDALLALGHGANGFISTSVGFDVFINAARFVSAGGTYVPPQCLLAAKPGSAAAPEPLSENAVTNRERAVIQAIRQGKPNKLIAYELNMCESTVKVHVRRILKKLHARNRTEVAIKAEEMFKVSARADASARRTGFQGVARFASAAP